MQQTDPRAAWQHKNDCQWNGGYHFVLEEEQSHSYEMFCMQTAMVREDCSGTGNHLVEEKQLFSIILETFFKFEIGR